MGGKLRAVEVYQILFRTFEFLLTFEGCTRIRTYDLRHSFSTNHDVDHNATEETYGMVNKNYLMKRIN